MCHLPKDIVVRWERHRSGRTDEALQPRFGISYNTLRQIESGHAVFDSVEQRLIDRIGAERLDVE